MLTNTRVDVKTARTLPNATGTFIGEARNGCLVYRYDEDGMLVEVAAHVIQPMPTPHEVTAAARGNIKAERVWYFNAIMVAIRAAVKDYRANVELHRKVKAAAIARYKAE